MPTVMVKATPVNGLVAFVRQDLDLDKQRAVEGQFAPGELAAFTGKLMASEVVALQLVDRYTQLAAAAKGEPVFEFARRAAWPLRRRAGHPNRLQVHPLAVEARVGAARRADDVAARLRLGHAALRAG